MLQPHRSTWEVTKSKAEACGPGACSEWCPRPGLVSFPPKLSAVLTFKLLEGFPELRFPTLNRLEVDGLPAAIPPDFAAL